MYILSVFANWYMTYSTVRCKCMDYYKVNKIYSILFLVLFFFAKNTIPYPNLYIFLFIALLISQALINMSQ